MKKTLLKTIAAATAGAMMLTMVGCGNKTDNSKNPPTPIENTTPATLAERADYLARAVDDHYVDRYDGQLYGAGYFDALGGDTDGYAHCYEYSSLMTMANMMYAISTDQAQKKYYKSLIDDYVGGLDNFTGSGTIMSTHGTSDWSDLYAVHRVSTAGEGNIEGDGMVYDDQMWIIRDFCKIYQTTGDTKYIRLAEHLTKACLDGWDSSKGSIGGITWGPIYNSKHTCSNAPIISALCDLAEYYKDKPDLVTADDTVFVEQPFADTYVKWDNMVGMKKYEYYLYWAKAVYDFTWTYLRATDYTFADNLRHERTVIPDENAAGGLYWSFEPYTGNAEGSKFTYNTGAVISGAAGLYNLTGDENYLVQGRLMSEGAYHYFVKTVTVDGKQMQMYDCRKTLLFNEVLMQGYLDLANVSKAKNSSINDDLQKELASYVKVFKTSINYAFDNYVINRTLPHNYLQGWLYGDVTYDTHKDIKDATATPIILALLSQYETNHGEIK